MMILIAGRPGASALKSVLKSADSEPEPFSSPLKIGVQSFKLPILRVLIADRSI